MKDLSKWHSLLNRWSIIFLTLKPHPTGLGGSCCGKNMQVTNKRIYSLASGTTNLNKYEFLKRNILLSKVRLICIQNCKKNKWSQTSNLSITYSEVRRWIFFFFWKRLLEHEILFISFNKVSLSLDSQAQLKMHDSIYWWNVND